VANSPASLKRLPEPILPILGLILAWGLLISQVRHHWGGESYYNFGWFVPPMAIWLLLRNLEGVSRSLIGTARTHFWLGALLLLPVIPLHALSEVNPFWRVPLWGQAVFLSAFTLLVLHVLYGRRGFLAGIFPVFFLCTMVPWPFRFEVWMVQSLTGIVVDFSVWGLHFLGYPVEVAGNSLRLGDIQIGVNEACSGIRSLQALFMVTLFLGSLFGQSSLRRLLAVAVLPVIVIIVNTGRAIFLSTQVIVNGQEAYEAWHDPAGYIAFGISMVIIYATIELLNIGGSNEAQSPGMDLAAIGRQWSATASRPGLATFVAAPVLVFLIVEGWFRYHEWTAPERRGWELSLPAEEDPDYHYAEIHESVSSLLGYSYGHRFFHPLSDDVFTEVYYYGYTEDNKLASVSSYGHSPAICMEAVGAIMLEEFDPLMVNAGDLRIPIRHYLFRLPRAGEDIHVFWIVWEFRNMDIDPEQLAELDYGAQLVQLMRGRRDFSRKVLLTSLRGIQDPDRAPQRHPPPFQPVDHPDRAGLISSARRRSSASVASTVTPMTIRLTADATISTGPAPHPPQ
jgi:exosortase